MKEQKSFQELSFADNYMFTRVMQNLNVCRKLLEILLGIKISKIRVPVSEATLDASYKAKSIRLDVRTSDPEHEYDIEMQTTNKTDLPLRARYYQSLMDIEATQRGTKYSNLKQNVVIFICLNDPFGQEEPIYTFRNMCEEKKDVRYEDKMIKVFYNCKNCDKIDDGELKALLSYVATKHATSSYTRQLEKQVRRLKVTPREQLYYDNWLEITDDMREDAMEEGYREGLEKGMQEGMQKGMQEGMQKGLNEGAKNKTIEIARNMCDNGIPVEQIATWVKLSVEEVKQIGASRQTQFQ